MYHPYALFGPDIVKPVPIPGNLFRKLSLMINFMIS
jgi:hypothetical protein